MICIIAVFVVSDELWMKCCRLRTKLCPNFGRSRARLCPLSFAPCPLPNLAGTPVPQTGLFVGVRVYLLPSAAVSGPHLVLDPAPETLIYGSAPRGLEGLVVFCVRVLPFPTDGLCRSLFRAP